MTIKSISLWTFQQSFLRKIILSLLFMKCLLVGFAGQMRVDWIGLYEFMVEKRLICNKYFFYPTLYICQNLHQKRFSRQKNHPHQFPQKSALHNSSLYFNNDYISLQFPFLWQTAAYQAITHIFITISLATIGSQLRCIKNCKLNEIYSSIFLHQIKASLQAFDSFLPKAHFRWKINEFRSKQKREKVSQFL